MPLDAQKQGQIVEFGEGWVCEKKMKKNGEMKKWGDGKADSGDGRWCGGFVVVMWRCLRGGVVIRSDV